MLYIVGTSISIFLTVLLLFKKNKHAADPILILWLLANALHQFLFYLDISGISVTHTFWAGLNIPFAYLHGPFLYLYISRILFLNKSKGVLTALHFLPFVLGFFYLREFYFLDAEQKVYNLNNELAGFAHEINMHFKAVLLSGSVYIVLSVGQLRKHKIRFKTNYSNTMAANYRWIILLIAGMVLIWIMLLIGNIQQVFLLVGLNTTIVGIFGIRNTPYFIDPIDLTSPAESKKYRKSGLTDSLKQNISKDLDKLMSAEQVFTDCDLSLDRLADRIQVHPNYLSQYINEELELSFYDYINKLRVEKFKELILLPEKNKFNFLAIALECGFNSKASFNRNFKKITGQTPSAYLESQE